MAAYETVDPDETPGQEDEGYVGVDPQYQNSASHLYAPNAEGAEVTKSEEDEDTKKAVTPTPPAPKK